MRRFVRLRSLLVLACLLASCTVLPPAERRPLDADQARRVRFVSRALAENRTDVAAQLEDLLVRYPDSIDARRLLQNFELTRGYGWRVYDSARLEAEASPGDPERLYLVARVIPDFEAEARLLGRCVRLAPSFFFGNYGLAVVDLERSRPEDALRFARRAVVIRPDDESAQVVLARSLAATGRRQAGEDLLAGLLAKDPRNAAAAAAASEMLVKDGRAELAFRLLVRVGSGLPRRGDLLVRAWDLLDQRSFSKEALGMAAAACRKIRAANPRSAAADMLLGRILLSTGAPGNAVRVLDRAVAEGAAPNALREERLRALLRSGAFSRAVKMLSSTWREPLLRDPGNRLLGAHRELVAALKAAAGSAPSAEAFARVSRALSATGFEEEAVRSAERAHRLAPGRKDLARFAEDARGWATFVEKVRAELRADERDGSRKTLKEVLARLAKISRETLGRDVVHGLPVESYAFVGEVARSDAPKAPAAWTKHGTLFVIGRLGSGPVQATMMRLAAWFPDRKSSEGSYTLAVGEGETLRSFFERGVGRIAGFTLPGWVLLDRDVVERWEAEIRRLATRPEQKDLWPAADRERRVSLWFPGGVREGLARRYVAAAGSTDGSLASALAHEKGHLLQARRYLPVGSHLLAVIGLLFESGFSEAGIEARLERGAQTHALLTSPWPRNALLDTMAFLPYEHAAPPHSVGYYQIMKRLIREIDRHPARYPSVDRRFNLLQQLDRLSDPEIRRLVREALGEGRKGPG